MNKLLLVDGNYLAYRGFYSTAYRTNEMLTNSKGIPMNAVLTFHNSLNKIIFKYNPTHILVAFDAGKKTIRHDKLDSYKAGRRPTPPELIQQIPILKEMLSKMEIIHHEIIGIEADDIIGTLTEKFKDEISILILSSDKDLFQLVQKNVSIILSQARSQKNKLINIKNFFNFYNYHPYQTIDLKGIAGDPSDNLSGVKGIGEVGAKKLLSKYDNLENIYKNLKNLPLKTQEKFIKSKSVAFMCKDLAKLFLNVKIRYKLDDLVFKNEMPKELRSFFKKYELNSLIKTYSNKSKKISSKEIKSFNKIIF